MKGHLRGAASRVVDLHKRGKEQAMDGEKKRKKDKVKANGKKKESIEGTRTYREGSRSRKETHVVSRVHSLCFLGCCTSVTAPQEKQVCRGSGSQGDWNAKHTRKKKEQLLEGFRATAHSIGRTHGPEERKHKKWQTNEKEENTRCTNRLTYPHAKMNFATK